MENYYSEMLIYDHFYTQNYDRYINLSLLHIPTSDQAQNVDSILLDNRFPIFLIFHIFSYL